MSAHERLRSLLEAKLANRTHAFDAATAQACCAEGADINAAYDSATSNGFNALAVAAKTGDAEMAAFLLKSLHADPNAVCIMSGVYCGWTPLMQAAWCGGTAVAQVLLRGGAIIDTRTAEGNTARTYASRRSHHDVVKMLDEAGAKPELRESIARAAKQGRQALRNSERDASDDTGAGGMPSSSYADGRVGDKRGRSRPASVLLDYAGAALRDVLQEAITAAGGLPPAASSSVAGEGAAGAAAGAGAAAMPAAPSSVAGEGAAGAAAGAGAGAVLAAPTSGGEGAAGVKAGTFAGAGSGVGLKRKRQAVDGPAAPAVVARAAAGFSAAEEAIRGNEEDDANRDGLAHGGGGCDDDEGGHDSTDADEASDDEDAGASSAFGAAAPSRSAGDSGHGRAKRRRKAIAPAVVERLLAKQGRVCAAFPYHPTRRCRQELRIHMIGTRVLRHFDVDHITPLRDGGADDISNYQILCTTCHRIKTAHEAEFRPAVGTGGGMGDSRGNSSAAATARTGANAGASSRA